MRNQCGWIPGYHLPVFTLLPNLLALTDSFLETVLAPIWTISENCDW